MSISRLLRPRSVAIVGASSTPGSLGAGVLANLPEALKRHLEALLALENRIVESRERRHQGARGFPEA